MSAPLFYLPRAIVLNGGTISAGAKLYAYAAGTLVAQDTYSDAALTTPNANPVIADAAGVLGPIYLDNLQYRFILKDSDDVEIYDQDDYTPFPATGLGSGALSKSSNYSLVVGDRDKFVQVSGSSTITLPAVADAGAGWTIAIVNVGSGTVTVDGDGAETINGFASVYLQAGEAAILSCDGSAWVGPIITRWGATWVTPYTVVATDILNLVAIGSGGGTVSLPAAATIGSAFRTWLFNKTSDASLTVDGDGAETVDGRTTIKLERGQIAMLLCDGSNWHSFKTPSEQTRVKIADETVNASTTLQDDDHLADFQILEAIYYGFEAYIYADGNNTADFDLAMAFSQAPQAFSWQVVSCDGNLNLRSIRTGATAGGELEALGATAGAAVGIHVKGMFLSHATTAGTLKLQWAQHTSDPSDSIFKKGSWMKVFPIG